MEVEVLYINEHLLATATYIGPSVVISTIITMPDIQYLNIIFAHLEVWSS